ncbi:toxin-antitoxin system YwqK family antitoxin [Verminephrobacter aporrectodeae]|uniref:hypothetical protein n=1 Tax=Verminephrobacter aporrectodeae TaxID=1110389 RepID=UPI0022432E64|nr:hypothetical protein [Verminephrobacter aporrectodeae]
MILLAMTISCSKPDANEELALVNQKLAGSKGVNCPDGSYGMYLQWGESGSQLACFLNHGPIVMVEDGYVEVEGQYSMGKQTGEWRWFNKGRVYRVGRYSCTKP